MSVYRERHVLVVSSRAPVFPPAFSVMESR